MKDAKGHGSDARGSVGGDDYGRAGGRTTRGPVTYGSPAGAALAATLAGMHSPANVLGENDSTYHGNAPAGGGWQTRLGFYSLDQGKVGQETQPPIVTAHGSPVEAMRSLSAAIDGKAGGDRPQTFHIVAPSGAKLSMNDAYRQHFGEAPRSTRSGYTYPRLKKGK